MQTTDLEAQKPRKKRRNKHNLSKNKAGMTHRFEKEGGMKDGTKPLQTCNGTESCKSRWNQGVRAHHTIQIGSS